MYEFLIKTIAAAQKNEKERQRVYGLISLNSEKQNDLTELEIEMDIEEAKAKQLSPEKLAEHTQRSVTPKKSQKAGIDGILSKSIHKRNGETDRRGKMSDVRRRSTIL